MLWKPRTTSPGHVETRRGRRFIVNAMATVGNYEYAFRWYFSCRRQPGGGRGAAARHGLNGSALADGACRRAANVVDRGLAAPHHQHMFCFRLDLDVDGAANVLREVQKSERIPVGPGQPGRQRGPPARDAVDGEGGRGTPRRRRARITWSGSCSTTAKDSAATSDGGPTAYRLVPGHGTGQRRLAQPGSSVDRRAGFARHRLWATRYDREARFPAGAYRTRRRDPGGLPAYSRGRGLEGEDIVLWYTLGVTHFVPAPENWAMQSDDEGQLGAGAGRLLRPEPDARRVQAATTLLCTERPVSVRSARSRASA